MSNRSSPKQPSLMHPVLLTAFESHLRENKSLSDLIVQVQQDFATAVTPEEISASNCRAFMAGTSHIQAKPLAHLYPKATAADYVRSNRSLSLQFTALQTALLSHIEYFESNLNTFLQTPKDFLSESLSVAGFSCKQSLAFLGREISLCSSEAQDNRPNLKRAEMLTQLLTTSLLQDDLVVDLMQEKLKFPYSDLAAAMLLKHKGYIQIYESSVFTTGDVLLQVREDFFKRWALFDQIFKGVDFADWLDKTKVLSHVFYDQFSAKHDAKKIDSKLTQLKDPKNEASPLNLSASALLLLDEMDSKFSLPSSVVRHYATQIIPYLGLEDLCFLVKGHYTNIDLVQLGLEYLNDAPSRISVESSKDFNSSCLLESIKQGQTAVVSRLGFFNWVQLFEMTAKKGDLPLLDHLLQWEVIVPQNQESWIAGSYISCLHKLHKSNGLEEQTKFKIEDKVGELIKQMGAQNLVSSAISFLREESEDYTEDSKEMFFRVFSDFVATAQLRQTRVASAQNIVLEAENISVKRSSSSKKI